VAFAIHELREKQLYKPAPLPPEFRLPVDDAGYKEWELIRKARLKKDPKRVAKGRKTHPRPHNDEAHTSHNLKVYGRELYPGIENTPTLYADDPKAVDPYKEFSDHGNICYGLGGHFLDDHAKVYEEAKICTTDLVNLHLGVRDKFALALSDCTRHCDRTRMVLPMEWPTLLKGQYRTEPADLVFGRAERLHTELRRFHSGWMQKQPKRKRPVKVTDYVNFLVDEFHGKPGERGLARVCNYLLKAENVESYDFNLTAEQNHGRLRPYELAQILRNYLALARDEREYSQAITFGRGLLAALVVKEMAFSIKRDKYKPQHQKFLVPGTDTHVTLAVLMNNDDPDLVKIARIKGADIIINRNSKGQVQIFTRGRYDDNGIPYAFLSLDLIVGHLRIQEILARGGGMDMLPNVNCQTAADVNVPGADLWHYVREGGYVLNGSDQAGPGVEPTKLALSAIMELVKKFIRLAPEGTVLKSGPSNPEEADDDVELDGTEEEELRLEEAILINTPPAEPEVEEEVAAEEEAASPVRSQCFGTGRVFLCTNY
jgi:hypothetical protein